MKTHQQKLAELTEKICELNQSIRELKFGCVVEICRKEIVLLEQLNDEKTVWKGYYKSSGRVETAWIGVDYKIIGRDITLFDILYCLRYDITAEDVEKITKLWKYPNRLLNQKNELIDLLYERICQKNKTRETRDDKNQTV